MSSEDKEQPLADFDLDAWLDGTTGITGTARIVQRGDLLAVRDRLEAELEVARQIPDGDRGVGDRTPQQIEAELEEVYEQIWSSMLWVTVQDRAEARREQIKSRLKKQGVGNEDISIHLIADAIVKVETSDGRAVPLPEDGFPPQKLRAIRDGLGDAALLDLTRTYVRVTSTAPEVRAPLSREPFSNRDGLTSRRRSAQRGTGASRR